MTDGLDIVVVGGGISGLGVAVESVRRGFRTAIVESGVFGGQTSSASLRIMHGGLRYLQTFDILRSIRSIRAQAELRKRYSDLVVPLICLLPASAGLKGPLPLRAASCLYRLLGAPWKTAATYLSSGDVLGKYPLYAHLFPHGALQWTDLQLRDPNELFARLLHEFSKGGGTVLPLTKVDRIVQTSKKFTLECSGAHGVFSLSTTAVINAAGPWIEEVRRSVQAQGKLKILLDTVSQTSPSRPSWCVGWNMVFNGELPYPVAVAVGADETSGRFHFIVPRGSSFAVGTDYQILQPTQRLAAPEISAKDTEALHHSAAKVFGRATDMAAIESGVLPFLPLDRAAEVTPLGREKLWGNGGYVEIMSTKFTTFLPQGRAALGKVGKALKTPSR